MEPGRSACGAVNAPSVCGGHAHRRGGRTGCQTTTATSMGLTSRAVADPAANKLVLGGRMQRLVYRFRLQVENPTGSTEDDDMAERSRVRGGWGWAAFTIATPAALATNACTAHVPAPRTGAITLTSPVITTSVDLATSTAVVAVSRPSSGDVCSEDHRTRARAPPTVNTNSHLRGQRDRRAPIRRRNPAQCTSVRDFHRCRQAPGRLSCLDAWRRGIPFSMIEVGKVSTGGNYYWIAGAVDKAVGSVVISLKETPAKVKATLVPLSTGWQGFAFE